MKQMKYRLWGVLVLLGMWGCSTMEIDSVYDQQADFTGYTSYAWLEPDLSKYPDKDAMADASIRAKVESAIDQELARRKFVKASSDKASFLIAAHLLLEEKQTVQMVNDPYGYGRMVGWPYGAATKRPADVTTYEFRKGSLIIDVVSIQDHALLWRGVATDEVNFNAKQSAKEAVLNSAVEKILNRFPPPTP